MRLALVCTLFLICLIVGMSLTVKCDPAYGRSVGRFEQVVDPNRPGGPRKKPRDGSGKTANSNTGKGSPKKRKPSANKNGAAKKQSNAS